MAPTCDGRSYGGLPIVLCNFNKYLGGGETLCVRLFRYLYESNVSVAVFCSEDSYISNELAGLPNIHEYGGSFSFGYMSQHQQSMLDSWLSANGFTEESQFVTFCFRDLYLLIESASRAGWKRIKITHLYLHPLDHLFLCQSLSDKALSVLGFEQKYSLMRNVQANISVVKEICRTKSQIVMNQNVFDRISFDCGVDMPHDSIIPLPCEVNPKAFVRNKSKSQFGSRSLRLVWLGRIVDFKIPALLAMIDYIATKRDVTLDIVGYGETKVIKRYINKRGVGDRVALIGKIEPSLLKDKLKNYDIGYAMGTSIIELTNCGLPVLVALASPDNKVLKGDVCAGLFHHQNLGNVGDDLYASTTFNGRSIDKSISEILELGDLAYKNDQDFVCSNFGLKNFSMYLDKIRMSESLELERISFPNTSPLRRFLHRVYS